MKNNENLYIEKNIQGCPFMNSTPPLKCPNFWKLLALWRNAHLYYSFERSSFL